MFVCLLFLVALACSVACRLTYVDEDGEEVELETDSDLTDAAGQAAARSPRLLEVFLRPPTHAHTNMLRSGLLDGEWESVQGDSNSPAVQSRSIAPTHVPAVAPAAAVVAAPLQPQEVEKKEEHKAESAAASPEKPAPVADEAAGQSSPPAVAVSAPAAAVPAASSPASSPSGFVGSLFSIFGRSAAAASPAAAATEPAAGSSADIVPDHSSSSDSLSASSASLNGSSASVVESAQRPFASWPHDSVDGEGDAQPISNSNSFVAAMDELAEEQRLQREQGSRDGRAQQALAAAFTAMLERAVLGLGLDGVAVPVAAAPGRREWVPRPSGALLAALSGIEASAFEPAVAQFVAVCTAHAAERERQMRQAEEEKLAALVAEMEREAEEKRRREEAEAEERRLIEEAEAEAKRQQEAEAEAAAAAVAQRQREEAEAAQRASAQAEAERAAAAEERAAEARAEADRAQQAAEPEEEQPQLPLEPCLMFASRVPVAEAEPEVAAAEPVAAPQPQSLANSPVLVASPAVSLPVAAPLDASAHSAAQRFNAALSELRDMGFGDDALNTLLLQRNGHDIGAVVDWLATNEACGGELKVALAAQLPQ